MGTPKSVFCVRRGWTVAHHKPLSSQININVSMYLVFYSVIAEAPQL